MNGCRISQKTPATAKMISITWPQALEYRQAPRKLPLTQNPAIGMMASMTAA